jgi:hypothetical protein
VLELVRLTGATLIHHLKRKDQAGHVENWKAGCGESRVSGVDGGKERKLLPIRTKYPPFVESGLHDTPVLAMFLTVHIEQTVPEQTTQIRVYLSAGKISWMFHQHIAHLLRSEQQHKRMMAKMYRCHPTIFPLQSAQKS